MRPALRLPLAGLALLLGAAAALLALSLREGEAAAAENARVRAQLVADAVASRVERAAALGIPLDQMQGVAQLFDERSAAFRDIASISLVDPAGRVVVRRGSRTPLAGEPATRSAVRVAGAAVAHIVLERGASPHSRLPIAMGSVAALAALFAALAAEALALARVFGRERRARVVAAACARAAGGDFSRRPPAIARHDFDLRPQWLALQMRQLHEKHLRVQRLAQSLRKTEPDPERRHALDEAIRLARAQDAFSEGPQGAMPLPPSGAALARAAGLALGMLAWAPGMALAVATDRAQLWPAWAWLAPAGGALALAAVLGALALRLREWPARATLAGLALGAGVAGPGLACAAVLIAQPAVAWAWEIPGAIAWAWVAAASALWLVAGTPDTPAAGDGSEAAAIAPAAGLAAADPPAPLAAPDAEKHLAA